MTKYLVEVREASTGDMTLLQLHAKSSEDATALAKQSYPECEVTRVTSCTHGGRRAGAGRVGKWGDGVATRAIRLPNAFADKAEDIIGEIEMINNILEAYEARIEESKSKTANGQPAERYKYVAQMLNDLRQAMQVTSGKLA